jgi:hypothetical protein
MSVEAVGESAEFEEIEPSKAARSQWNGREIQSSSLTREEAIIRGLALAVMGAWWQGELAARRMDRIICDLVKLDEEDQVVIFAPLVKWVQEHAIPVTPELAENEEYVRTILKLLYLRNKYALLYPPTKPNFLPPKLPPVSTHSKLYSPGIVIVDPDGPVRGYDLPYKIFVEKIRSSTFQLQGTPLKRGAIGGINGVANELHSARENAEYLQQLAKNVNIEWVHNASHGPFVDLLEASFINFPGYSGPAKLLIENWKRFHENHKNDPDAKYLQFCHSQGTTHVRNALLRVPKEIQDRIIVVAIAPASIITDDICHQAFNYASKDDLVLYIEPAIRIGFAEDSDPEVGEFYKGLLSKVVFLEPHPKAFLLDHDWQSPTFYEVIERHVNNHIAQFK